MTKTLAQSPVSAPPGTTTTTSTQHPRKLAETINGKCKASIDCHLLFLAELNGGRGHGQVPRDDREKGRYFAAVRIILKRDYDLTDETLARVISTHRMPNVGPLSARKILLEKRPDKANQRPAFLS